MKKILLFLLLSIATYGQVSTGQEQEFDYGIKNNAAQTITTPTYIGTLGTDGTNGKIPSAYIEKTDNKQNSLAIDGTGVKYPTVDAVNDALPKNYAKIVYVNSTNPSTATIFDIVNPPVTNDNLLKTDVANLYIGTDASTWVWNGSTYVTKTVPDTSNFNLDNGVIPPIDAGNNKTATIKRMGGIISEGAISGTSLTALRNGSDTPNNGAMFSMFNTGITGGNMFQLNASNGLDLWNYASSTWTKIFTFSSAGVLTANSFIKSGGTGSQALLANGSVLTNPISGTGTTNYIPKFTTTGTVGNSNITDNGTLVSTSTDMSVNGLTVGRGGGNATYNTGIGSNVLNSNTGNYNTAIGYRSLYSNLGGSYNTAIGMYSQYFNTTANNNVSFGVFSLYNNNGSENLGFGYQSGRYIIDGVTALTMSSSSIFLGTNTKALSNSQTNQIVIGANSTGLGSNTTVLGNSLTVQTWLGGRVTVGSTVDDGVNALQVTGSAALKTAPTTSASTYDILTRNSSTGLVEKALLTSFVANAITDGVTTVAPSQNAVFDALALKANATSANFIGQAEFNGGARFPSGASIHFNTGGSGLVDDVNGNAFTTSYPSVGWVANSKITANSFVSNGVVRLKNYTVATLPTGTQGDTAYVTDALAPAYLVTVVGGGAVVCPVFYNGTSWVSH